jgi:hypothetical protein
MKRKIILVAVLALSLVIMIAVAAVFPAVAANKTKTIESTNQGHISLELPPPGGAVAGHPTNIVFSFYDYSKGPASPADVIVVYIWISSMNKYIPIAAIADQPPNAKVKQFWNNTPVYLEVDGIVMRNNLKVVADKELDVWMECKRADDEVFIANLTVPVGPLDYTSLPSSVFGSTFTVPAMEVTFRQTAESYREEVTEVNPDGSIEKTITTKVPAWVFPRIPAWFNGPCQDVGAIFHQTVITTIP